MVDRVRFKEFAQVRKNNKTIAWPAGEYDYVPEMDPILADGRAVRVSPSTPVAAVSRPVEPPVDGRPFRGSIPRAEPADPLVAHMQGTSAPPHVQAAQMAPAPPLRLPKQGKG